MKRDNPVSLVMLLLGVAIMLLFMSSILWAGGLDVEQETEVVQNAKGSSSWGLASSLGDVDINDCVISKQMSVLVVWSGQKYDYNMDCIADRLDRSGKYVAAATLRCTTIPGLTEVPWPDGETCIDAMTLNKSGQNFNVESDVKVDEDEDDYHEEHENYLAELEGRMVQRMEQVEASVQEPRQTIVTQIPTDYEQRIEKARAVREKYEAAQ